MKLVELLARELVEWPEDAHVGMQDPDLDNTIWFLDRSHAEIEFKEGGWYCHGSSFDILISRPSCLASDYETAIVGRDEWQAERDKQKGGEWKRHRGGDRPKSVSDGEMVEVRLRDGAIMTSQADEFIWNHGDCDESGNITKYRVISQPQAEEPMKAKFDGVKLEFSRDGVNFSEIGTARIDNICDLGPVEPQWQQSTGPLAWRDTIIHCQAIIEDCEREIDRNTQQLAAEGFELIAQINSSLDKIDATLESAVDMGDWRNWKKGDMIECVYSTCSGVYHVGGLYYVNGVCSTHADVQDDCGVGSSCNIADKDFEDVQFIRRP